MLGPFCTIMENTDEQTRAAITKATITFHELITKHGIGQDMANGFAQAAGTVAGL